MKILFPGKADKCLQSFPKHDTNSSKSVRTCDDNGGEKEDVECHVLIVGVWIRHYKLKQQTICFYEILCLQQAEQQPNKCS